MKFTCSTKDFSAAVAAASKVVNGHTTVPILSNLHIAAVNDNIRVRATDLELTIERVFSGEVHENGSATLPAKLFSGYLGNLPPGLLELIGSATRASVRAERSNYDFHSLPADEYPPLPAARVNVSFSMNAHVFADGIQSTIFCASNEEARGAAMMGALLEIEGETISLVATDGYRLGRWTAKLDAPPSGGPLKYIVPARALAEAVRNMAASETIEFTALGAQSNQLAMKAGTTSIFVRLVDAQYPNYGQVIPARFDRTAKLNTTELVGALRRAELMSVNRASLVQLKIADGQMMILANSDTAGNAYEELIVDQTGNDITIALNARYLIEILNHIATPQVLMEFSGALSPMLIRPVELNNDIAPLYVLMPLRH
jgi:DNA polymerase-3 subunit beta